MKHTLSPLFLAAALTLAGTACMREEVRRSDTAEASHLQDVLFSASLETPSGAKTALSSDTDAGSAYISWTADDALTLHYAGGSQTASVCDITTDAYSADHLSAVFSAALSSDVTDLYAVYPASATSSLSDGTLSVTIPAAQDGSFKGADFMAAKTTREEAELYFCHLASYLEIKVNSASVASIVIAGENGEALTGTLPVTFDEDDFPVPGTATSTATAITLTATGAGYYYAALLPGVTFSKGLSLRFYDSEGNILNSYCHQNVLTTVRGTIHFFTDESGMDGRSRYLYATVSGAGDKDGSSWAHAMSQTELYAFLNDAQLKKGGVLTTLTDAQKDALDGVTVRLGAGTYAMGAIISLQNLCTTTDKSLSLVGGYPAAGGTTASPATNITTFSGEDSYRILSCNVKSTEKKITLSLSGITFSHSLGTEGGAAAVGFYGAGNTVTISNCIFSDNVNTASIAGLQIAYGSQVEVNDCRFLRNQAVAGAAANVDSDGSTGTFTDCVFSSNTTTGNGGACKFSESASNATMTFERCVFTANHGRYGGAFYCNAPATAEASFIDCTFGDENDADLKNYADTYGGGAMYIGLNGYACTVSCTGCFFYGNTAKSGGGAIHVSNALNASSASCASNLSLTDCAFTGNSVTHDASTKINGCGGAVDFRSSGTLTISGCTFKQNFTTRSDTSNGYLASGGAVCISDGNLTSDDAPVYATVNITGTTFEGNHTSTARASAYHQQCGGAIAVICGNDGTANRKSYANVRIDKCNFLDNYANQGGALFLGGGEFGIGGTTFLNDCLFDGNYILHAYGTIINTYVGGTLCINNATFHNSWSTTALGQWRCWININRTNFILSNSSVVGQTQGSSDDTADDTGDNPSLIRFDSGDFNTSYWAAFQNNLIVNTKATDASSAYYSFVNNSDAQITRDNDSPRSGFRPFMSNKITHVCQNGKGFDTAYPTAKGGSFTSGAYASTLTGLTWNTGSPRTYLNCYWSWTSCTANSLKPTLADITTDVTNDLPAFGAWLSTSGIDGFSKDQIGNTRPSSVKAGAVE